jgi:hypothetical protein
LQLQSFSAIISDYILIPIVVVVVVLVVVVLVVVVIVVIVVLVVVVLVVVILIFVTFKGSSFVKLDVGLEIPKSDSRVVLSVFEVVLLGVEIMVVCMKKNTH